MSTRNFIRHLEPYGYIDQSKYDRLECNVSGSATVDIDLSDLYDADKDINDRIDDLCERQSQINNEFNHRINANTSNISALTDALEDVTCRVTDIEDTLSAHTEEIGTISGDVESLKESATTLFEQDEYISGVVNNLLSELVGKADKGDSYLKEETYSKEEVDAIVEGINEGMDDLSDELKQWVEDKGYATLEYANATFETKEEAQAEHDALDEKIENEISRSTAKDEELENSISDVSSRIDELEEKHDQDISDLRNADNDINDRIDVLNSNLDDLAEVVDTKASQEALDETNENLAYVSGQVDTKVSNAEFEAYKNDTTAEISTINSNIEDLYTNKADKSELAAVSASVDDVASNLAQEIEDRVAADNAVQEMVNDLNMRVENVETANTSQEQAIQDLRDALNQEIEDRTNGDIDLIGTPNDASDMDTINAAKNYAKGVGATVSAASKSYTDDKVTALKNQIDERMEQQESTFATKEYVRNADDNLKNYADEKVADEASAREVADIALQRSIDQYNDVISEDLSELNSGLSHFASVLKAVTEWDGEDPSQYTDDGNGILDVLHKEFHELSDVVDNHTSNDDIHVTAEDKARWDAGTGGGGVSPSAFTAHTANTVVHVSQADRDRWDAAAGGGVDPSEFIAHTSNTIVHTSQAEKNKWNAKADTSAVTSVSNALEAEVSRATTKEGELEEAIAAKADASEIPTDISELNNDRNFVSVRIEGTNLILD